MGFGVTEQDCRGGLGAKGKSDRDDAGGVGVQKADIPGGVHVGGKYASLCP